jgi:hypothetical protein
MLSYTLCVLSVRQVLARTTALFFQQPLPILWLVFASLSLSLLSLGLLAGPMQVGLYRSLLHRIRQGVWDVGLLWDRANINAYTLPAGLVFAVLLVALVVFGRPLENLSQIALTAFNFVTGLVLNLLWFYTFQVMADQPQPWVAAMRKGWQLMQSGGWRTHILLAGLLTLLTLLPTDAVEPVLQILVTIILLSYANLAQTVAYATVVDTMKPPVQ